MIHTARATSMLPAMASATRIKAVGMTGPDAIRSDERRLITTQYYHCKRGDNGDNYDLLCRNVLPVLRGGRTLSSCAYVVGRLGPQSSDYRVELCSLCSDRCVHHAGHPGRLQSVQ